MPNLNERVLERRVLGRAEFRIAPDGKRIEGHAAVFNSPTSLPWFDEQVAPGAFAKSIQESDVRALFNHDPNYVLGRNKAGTLELSEDSTGLLYRVTPPDAQWARDLMESMRRGDVSQSSFGFRTMKDSWDATKDPVLRTLNEVQLFDVSPVTYPAYEDTDCGLRSMVGAQDASPALFRAMLKLQGCHTLTAEEINLVKDHVAALEGRKQGAPAVRGAAGKDVQEPGQPSATHSSIDVLRRRLDLAERGI